MIPGRNESFLQFEHHLQCYVFFQVCYIERPKYDPYPERYVRSFTSVKEYVARRAGSQGLDRI
jgi:hypothetical protein